MEKTKEHVCANCHEAFNIWDTKLINRGIEGKEFRICNSCADAACNSGKIIQCGACGESFTSDVLHDEVVCGHSFTACPVCGKDVVEGMTREDFEHEYHPIRYAVIVRSVNGGQRGYIVSVECDKGISGVIKKLAEKVNLDSAASITVAEILLEEDVLS